MTALGVALISGTIMVVFGVITSIISFLIKKTVYEKLGEVMAQITSLSDKFTSFKEEVLTDYVRKEDFSSNETSHKEMWKELNSTKERITALETLQSKGK